MNEETNDTLSTTTATMSLHSQPSLSHGNSYEIDEEKRRAALHSTWTRHQTDVKDRMKVLAQKLIIEYVEEEDDADISALAQESEDAPVVKLVNAILTDAITKNCSDIHIEQYEKTSRSFYGGAIGFMDFEGNFNHAIMIRTFLSKNHKLHWQAGAGLVSKSNPETELQEVYNKLGALTKAIELAENI